LEDRERGEPEGEEGREGRCVHLSAWCVGGLVPFVINITHLRIKPLALASGQGRYITVTPERTFFCVQPWPLHIAVINL
jgi:hypothetical protein